MTAHAPASPTMSLIDWMRLLALSLLWGGSFLFNALALREVPVLTMVAMRVALAALILAAVMRWQGVAMPKSGRVWLAFLGMGLLNNVLPFSLIIAGQHQLASGMASVLNAATPLFTVLAAHVLTRDERLTLGKLTGVLIGFAGVAVMMPGGGAGGGPWQAKALCLMAALSYALASIFGRRFRALGLAPLQTAAGQLTASSLVMWPLALLVDRPWQLPMPGLVAISALGAVALLSTAMAYVLYFRILASAGAVNLALVTLLIPVSATMLGVVILHEAMTLAQIGGIALIGLGLAAIDGRLLRRLRA